MLSLSHRVTRWVLAMSMACMLLAWPLHQAQHAAEPVDGVVAAWADAAADVANDADSPSPGQAGNADACAWCLFHGQHHLVTGTPPVFQLHAEASAPPARLPQGLPAGHSELAASPRGPPHA